MVLSIIIPVHNRAENIVKTLMCLSRQIIQPHHQVYLIVVDHASTDGTRTVAHNTLVNQFPFDSGIIWVANVADTVFSLPRTKWSAAIPRNFGVAHAPKNSDAFLFLDSDILLPPDRIQRYIDDFLQDPDPQRVIIGPYHYAGQPLSIDDASWWQHDITNYQQDVRWKSFEEHPVEEKNTGVGFALACFGGSLLVPASLFLKSGGYDEYITSGCEDGDYGLTLWESGARFSMDKGLLGWHTPHVITPDRTSEIPHMVAYIDEKHHMDLVKASGEAYRQWDISWQLPESWKENHAA